MAFLSTFLAFFLICSVLFWGYSERRGVGRSLRSLAGLFDARVHTNPAPLAVTIDDVSRLNKTDVAEIVHVRSEEDVRAALERARRTGKHVSIAGRRHSMGGQSFDRGNIVLDMLGFGRMSLDSKTQVLTVQSGAIWEDVQQYLDPLGRSVQVMQSDNIFSVGGTVSVNAHGWTPLHGPIASTVQGFRIMLASGEIKSCSRTENPELFRAALGGYGLLGVLLDVQLQTAPNVLCRYQPYFIPAKTYAEAFLKHVDRNPQINLAYGRLSVDQGHFLSVASLHTYEVVAPQPEKLTAMHPEEWVTLKNKVFRASERTNAGKARRWLLEREASRLAAGRQMTRNTMMSPDIHVLWPQDLRRHDILHEYFIPYEKLNSFREAMQELIPRYQQNLLNVTLRDVRQDADTLLAYAPSDRCAVVLFISQEETPEAEARMKAFTQKLVDAALREGGSFYLPYRLHYTLEQFHRAYPQFGRFIKLKQVYDPQTLFTSQFYDYVITQI